MGLINYSDINFEIKQENTKIDFNGTEIIVVPYLSINDKYDLIHAVMKESFDGKIYQPILLNAYLDFYIVYMYTNIVFSEENKADKLGLYDTLVSSGLLGLVLNAIPFEEITQLKDLLYRTLTETEKYNKSIIGMFNNLIEALPEKLEPMLETLGQLSPELVEQIAIAAKATETEQD